MDIGHTIWVISGGQIPLRSTGREPEFTSRDQLCFLNTGKQSAAVTLTIYYTDQEPAGPYRLRVEGERVRKVRVNDLVDPLPVFLNREYAMVVQSDIPLVVQFSRMHTGQASLAGTTTMAYAGEI